MSVSRRSQPHTSALSLCVVSVLKSLFFSWQLSLSLSLSSVSSSSPHHPLTTRTLISTTYRRRLCVLFYDYSFSDFELNGNLDNVRQLPQVPALFCFYFCFSLTQANTVIATVGCCHLCISRATSVPLSLMLQLSSPPPILPALNLPASLPTYLPTYTPVWQ